MISYTHYLEEIDAGRLDNGPAPKIAHDYWDLPAAPRLRDVVLKVREDEAGHRDRNHDFANQIGVARNAEKAITKSENPVAQMVRGQSS